ncbi:MAG: helix-turn-helix transcriptional regulator [Clostridia bacterium]|nr:helix-turn-helix transcriptional regulator [Clostridia bacterium]MBQ1933647.1 helix-turn-helix transcriptional regulator [Clostridia bacterium]
MLLDLNEMCITRIYNIFNINVHTQKRVTRTDRKRCALTVKLGGKTEYICDQKKYICDPHNVLLLPKNKPYTYEILELGPCISIEFECVNDIEDFHSFKLVDNTEIRKLLNNMTQLWKEKSVGYMLSVFSELYELLHLLSLTENVDYVIRKKEKALFPVITYVSEHYADTDITNEKLASIANMSTVYFRKLFTQRYGISPMKYLTNIRIETAKNLLLSGNLSVSEVGDAVGFSSVYSFSRAFKKHAGLSPTDFTQNAIYPIL